MKSQRTRASEQRALQAVDDDLVAETWWSGPDEGWGVEQAEVQQSSSAQDIILLETEISELRGKMRSVEEERNRMSEDMTAAL